MNERIRELAKQAHFRSDQIWLDQDRFEKFAELIVRECCGILTENVEIALNASGSSVYPEGLIYEHFGVEE